MEHLDDFPMVFLLAWLVKVIVIAGIWGPNEGFEHFYRLASQSLPFNSHWSRLATENDWFTSHRVYTILKRKEK